MARILAANASALLGISLIVACHSGGARESRPKLEDSGPRTSQVGAGTLPAGGSVGVAGTPAPLMRDASSTVDVSGTGAAASARNSEVPTDSGLTQPGHEEAVSPVPPLVDEAGVPLPQTDERPSASSSSFELRMALLVQAIREDRPEIALPSFFPVEAYKQVKAIEKPERDWEARLVRAFERNIHEYHKALGPSVQSARMVEVELPEPAVKWMKPGREGNRVGYYRVLRSKLIVATEDRPRIPLELTSLISWRGEWYVVHLHGF